ncbi:hypothetical protein BDV36DRAFT_302755 [Aspergillus pseudocaelatus]|uniref:Tat pathway signal sequence domain protein n=1 Tax=Aspergillus pseudocaelatus TaxID=1825620 RepID=A0ABQ6VZW9_9EURO|nr:hypothetical protein BDV36DRAFT_302755 [Aspergillus pseudocaelatus]
MSTNNKAVKLQCLERYYIKDNFSATFGVPWPRGEYWPDRTIFTCSSHRNKSIALQSWLIAYWPDGSIKWTAHAFAADTDVADSYSVEAILTTPKHLEPVNAGISIKRDADFIEIGTGKVRVVFPTTGSEIIKSIILSNGTTIGQNGRLIMLSRALLPAETDKSDNHQSLSSIESVNVDQEGPIRALLTVRGNHSAVEIDGRSQAPWLPFILRFYLYYNSDSIRIVHTITYDGDPQTSFIEGIGIQFDVPLEDELPYNRHIRFAGVGDGIFGEAVQGVTGLRRDPGSSVRTAQINGEPLPPMDAWNDEVGRYMKWVPCWNDYRISQLSPDGYTMKKRTAAGHSWVNIPGGTQAGGLAYLGGATRGGLGMGMRYFWERYPTGLDVLNANEATGEITLWLYSPSAEVMDLRPYHDGLGQETYDDELDALRITYEDWEDGTGTPFGIARTNEIFLFAFDHTPTSAELSSSVQYMRNPPVVIPDPEYILQTGALGTFWSRRDSTESNTPAEAEINQNLDFLFEFYKTQISQRRWYGFWNHGDIMHTYDGDRHSWCYDIGGYAWDNSELSPDLFFWLYFLRTSREDVYRLAEALTRHTGEVDVYHIGRWRGLGTRHGVQHWSDSCKQSRISNALYRWIFFYLTGGDERTGELLEETLCAEKTFLALDPYRKVRRDKTLYNPTAEAVSISLGTDWSAFAAAWFIAWERRAPGWEEAKSKLFSSMAGISQLHNGFVTGMALYNMQNGQILPPSHDLSNQGVVQVSHLSAMFGLFEICAVLIDTIASDLPRGFEKSWVEYCLYFNATAEDQAQRYGVDFGNLILRQGHSRLTAYAANNLEDSGLGQRSWKEFYNGDGYAPDLPWVSQSVTGYLVPVNVEEANWISTNISSLYGLAAIQNLSLVRKALS